MKFNKVVISVIGVVTVLTLAWHTRANADVGSQFQPVAIKKAERALNQGDPARALAMLSTRVDESVRPEFRSDAYGVMCRAYFQQGDYERAEQACDSALKLGGDAVAWSHLNNRGIMRMAQGRLDEAIEDFNAARRINPTARSVRSNLAMANRLKRAQPLEVSATH